MPLVVYEPGAHVHCPHCARAVRLLGVEMWGRNSVYPLVTTDGCRLDGGKHRVTINAGACPACERVVVQITEGNQSRLVVPRTGTRPPIHPSVPAALKQDYDEAVLVLEDSPKASAALSRRCLQTLLVLQGAKKSDLVDQMTEIYGTLPSYAQTFVDSIRKLGNLAAHAKASKSTGEIIDVASGEAEWMLELLEELFDHYYTKPAEAQAKQAALNAKFGDAGKLKGKP